MSKENQDKKAAEKKVDWEARYKELADKNAKMLAEKEDAAPAPAPVTSNMDSHAYSTPQQLEVDGLDPNKHYRWVSKYDPKLKYLNNAAVNQRRTKRYEVVSDPEQKLQGPRMMGGSNLETHDLILMETSKEIMKKEIMVGPNRAKERVTAVREAHKSGELHGKMANTEKTYSSSLQMMNEGDTMFEI